MPNPEEYQHSDMKRTPIYLWVASTYSDIDIERTDGLMGMKVRRESLQWQGNERKSCSKISIIACKVRHERKKLITAEPALFRREEYYSRNVARNSLH